METSRQNPRSTARETTVSRRTFLGTTASVAAAGTLFAPHIGSAAPSRGSAAETAVGEFYLSLTDDQKKMMALPLNDNRRLTINPNWHITKAKIGSFSKKQQGIIENIVKGICSEDGFERFKKQMADDAGGIKNYSVALFGQPGTDKPFEFELTGRHHTSRADGNSLEGVAFGGPIVYGHAAKGNSDKNLFSYQTDRANEVFKALDTDQRTKALLDKAPSEGAVTLRKAGRKLPGIACADLSGDQKELVTAVLKDIMLPYREEDVDEAMKMVEAGGGMDKVHISFYKTGDIDNDGSWDIWRLEGPTLVTHFRGAPHVHAYINVAKKV
ncbi:MAG: hypothetical protein COA78_09705 [Blastopirellula sp.]|nr:MAG: hypothetical protein COA78_09705 [Blastopirellula sp.]